jgi:peptide/nickel transport system permease protein
MASATVLIAFVVVGLLDSLHYRPRLENTAGQGAGSSRSRSTRSKCCRCSTHDLTPLRTRNEKTYSEPLATRAHAKESIEVRGADGELHTVRDYPRLQIWRRASRRDEAGATPTSAARAAGAGHGARLLVGAGGRDGGFLARREACSLRGGVAANLAQRERFCLECGARTRSPGCC